MHGVMCSNLLSATAAVGVLNKLHTEHIDVSVKCMCKVTVTILYTFDLTDFKFTHIENRSRTHENSIVHQR